MNKPEILIDAHAVLAEGPCWDPQRRVLYWTDGLGSKIHRYHRDTGENETMELDQYVGCVVPRKEGGLIAAMQHGIYCIDDQLSAIELINDIERDIENNRLNDGKCDSRGRLWFGSMSMTANQEDREFEVTGSFYCLDRNLQVHKQFGGVGISNGIAWNRDESVMYYIDTVTGQVAEFPFDPDIGITGPRKTAVEIPKEEGLPDGMTIDEEGMLWVAHFFGGCVTRWDPRTGRRLAKISLPATNVTCCAFGGSDLDELYMTTARIELTPDQLKQEPHAGAVFVTRPGVRGTAPNFW